MHENILYDYTVKFPISELACLNSILADLWSDITRLYSYIISVREEISVRYIIAEVSYYNTILVEKAIAKINDKLGNFTGEGVLIFEQAPIDLYIKLHEPMIEKMANKMLSQWPKLEYDDLCQICRLCCVELYEKGYYLHKRLIWTTFKNRIISEIRPLKRRGEIVSIYDKSYEASADSGDKDLTIADTIIDVDELYKVQDEECKKEELMIFEEVKSIIIELLGQRQFDTLYRDYTKKHTTTASRKLLIKVKNHLTSLGLTRSDFNKKYH